jgi:hypothetical protein
MPHGIVVLDRYYNSLAPYQPPRPNLYGVNVGDFLSFRYVDFDANRLILRPHALDHPGELLNLGPDESLGLCRRTRLYLYFRDITSGNAAT